VKWSAEFGKIYHGKLWALVIRFQQFLEDGTCMHRCLFSADGLCAGCLALASSMRLACSYYEMDNCVHVSTRRDDISFFRLTTHCSQWWFIAVTH